MTSWVCRATAVREDQRCINTFLRCGPYCQFVRRSGGYIVLIVTMAIRSRCSNESRSSRCRLNARVVLVTTKRWRLCRAWSRAYGRSYESSQFCIKRPRRYSLSVGSPIAVPEVARTHKTTIRVVRRIVWSWSDPKPTYWPNTRRGRRSSQARNATAPRRTK